MNPQIKQLAEKAGFNVEFEPSDDENDRSYQVVDNDFAERFAELIVRECRKVIADDIDDNSGDDFDLGLDHARQIIGEHFGVEE
jgi:hypothetical protein